MADSYDFDNFDPFLAIREFGESNFVKSTNLDSTGNSNDLDLITKLSNMGITWGVNAVIGFAFDSFLNYLDKRVLKERIKQMLIYVHYVDDCYDKYEVIGDSTFDLMALLYENAKERADKISNKKSNVYKSVFKGIFNTIKNKNYSLDGLIGETGEACCDIDKKYIPKVVSCGATVFLLNCFETFNYINKKQFKKLLDHYTSDSLTVIEKTQPIGKHPLGDVVIDDIHFTRYYFTKYFKKQYELFELLQR